MKTAAFIPIKSNSERVESKNFRKLCGRKLYEHILINALECKAFDHIYVDTDSDEIAKYCSDMDISVISRAPHLAENSANGNDLLNYHRECCPEYDLYFQLFATAPYLRAETISKCVTMLTTTAEHDSIMTVTKERGWYWFGDIPVNYIPTVLPRSQDAKCVIKETTGLYGITAGALDKYKCRIGANPMFVCVDPAEAIDLDTLDDFKRAEQYSSSCSTEIPNPWIYDDE